MSFISWIKSLFGRKKSTPSVESAAEPKPEEPAVEQSASAEAAQPADKEPKKTVPLIMDPNIWDDRKEKITSDNPDFYYSKDNTPPAK